MDEISKCISSTIVHSSFRCHINVDEVLGLCMLSSVFVVVCLLVWIQILCSFKISSYFFLLILYFLNKLKAALWLII